LVVCSVTYLVSEDGAAVVVVVAKGGVLAGLVSGAVVVVNCGFVPVGSTVVVGALGTVVTGAIVVGGTNLVVGGGVVSLDGEVVGAAVTGGFVSGGGVVSFGLSVVVAMIGGVVSADANVVVVRGGFVSGEGGLATVDVVVADRGGFVSGEGGLATVDVVADRGGFVSGEGGRATVEVAIEACVVVAAGLGMVRGVDGSVRKIVEVDTEAELACVAGGRSSEVGWWVADVVKPGSVDVRSCELGVGGSDDEPNPDTAPVGLAIGEPASVLPRALTEGSNGATGGRRTLALVGIVGAPSPLLPAAIVEPLEPAVKSVGGVNAS
jgi:hypothetical protein